MALQRTESPLCFDCSHIAAWMIIGVFPVPIAFLSGEVKQWLLHAGMVVFRPRLVTDAAEKVIFNLLSSTNWILTILSVSHAFCLSHAITIQSWKMFFYYHFQKYLLKCNLVK